jgi:hypothetical protein
MRPLMSAVARRAVVLTAIFVFAAAVSTANAQGRVRSGHLEGRHARLVAPSTRIIVRPGLHDPFFWGPYPYWTWGYPYAYRPYVYDVTPVGSVKTEVTPKQTEVYVDGYFAGVAGDFDGAFEHLRTSPGGHAITLRLDGYRTVTENIYVRPDSTYKLKESMARLAPGETSAPVPPPSELAAGGSLSVP